MKAVIGAGAANGAVRAIPSKSDVHRLMICAAFADRPTELRLSGTSEDIEATAGCLRALGAEVTATESGLHIVPVDRTKERTETPLLDCGESGSTLRFLLPVAAAVCKRAGFTGHGRLPQRPLGQLEDALCSGGTKLTAPALPLETRGQLAGSYFEIAGDVSSQYVTGLLLAMPLMCREGEVRVTTRLSSAAYVDMTVRAMARFGVTVTKQPADGEGVRFLVSAPDGYRSPGSVTAEGDWSNAAFILAAGALTGSAEVTGLSHDSPQGDKAVADILAQMGARVERNADGIRCTKPENGRLRGCEIDVSGVPDLLPILATAAMTADGETRFTGAARLRFKESDRLAAVCAMIRALGGRAEEQEDGITVAGGAGRIDRAEVDGFGDHRIVMSAAVAAAALLKEGGAVTIRGAQAVRKSYPTFFGDFGGLGMSASLEDDE